MLSFVAIYHCMQFPRKLMNETWKNDKKSSFRSDFGLFGADLGPKRIFYGFHLCKMLDITASYHCMQFQGKLMNQTWENGKNPIFGPDFGPFGTNSGCQKSGSVSH